MIGAVAVGCAVASVAVWLGVDGATLPLGTATVRASVAIPFFAAGACLLSLSLGAAMRSGLATIGVILGWVLIVEPMLTAAVPDTSAWLPFAGAGEAIVGSTGPDLLSRPLAALMLCAYIALAGCFGARRLSNADIT